MGVREWGALREGGQERPPQGGTFELRPKGRESTRLAEDGRDSVTGRRNNKGSEPGQGPVCEELRSVFCRRWMKAQKGVYRRREVQSGWAQWL